VDQADAAEFFTAASSGVRHCFLHQLHSNRLPCIESHSFLVYGEISILVWCSLYCESDCNYFL